jgi:CHASE2 domain-containing sensor protein
MEALHKVTYDPRSGRPIAPVWWRMSPFFVAYAWVMAAILLLLAYTGLRHGDMKVAAGAVVAGVFILAFVYWVTRRIGRERGVFNERVKAYEDAIAKPTVNGI